MIPLVIGIFAVAFAFVLGLGIGEIHAMLWAQKTIRRIVEEEE